MRRILRPTVTVIALLGLGAVAAFALMPTLPGLVFKKTAQTEEAVLAPAATAPALTVTAGTLDTLPSDQAELELLAQALKQAQAEQAAELSVITPAAGDTAP